jgi:hypothetical protein
MTASALGRWFFRDRRTGRITIAQKPNALSASSTALAVAELALRGRPARVAKCARRVVVTAWAADELARGVNPWRRTLGASVLALQLRGLARA